MSWKAEVVVATVSGNTLYATTSPDGSVSGTEDDASVNLVGLTITYADSVPDHLKVGSKFEVTANC